MAVIENSLQETAVSNESIQKLRMQIQTTLELVMGDSSPELLNEMAKIFLEDAVPLFNQMKTGLSNRDLSAVAMAAHALKGSSATIGLDQFAQLCLAVETSCIQNESELVGKHLATLEHAYVQVEQALTTFLQ